MNTPISTISPAVAQGMSVIDLRSAARQAGVQGKGVSAMNKLELVTLLTTGVVSERIQRMTDKPVTFNGKRKPATNGVARKARVEQVVEDAGDTIPAPATVTPAPKTVTAYDGHSAVKSFRKSLNEASGHGIGTAIDGIVDTDEDVRAIREAEAKAGTGRTFETVASLREALESVGYLISTSSAAVVLRAMATRPIPALTMQGPAGTGKTFLAKMLAQLLGATLVDYSCVLGTKFDDLTVKVAPEPNAKSGISEFRGPIARAAVASWFGKVVLLLDEWDKTHHHADNDLLQLLQDGKVSVGRHVLRFNTENTLFLLGANFERDLSEPLLRRAKMLPFNYLHPRDILKGLIAAGHEKSGHLHVALSLYVKTCMAAKSDRRMRKPATIQELDQFLTDIASLGDEADGLFEHLVYANITKTAEQHAALLDAQNKDYDESLFKLSLGGDKARGKKLNATRFGLSAAAGAVAAARDEGMSILPRKSTKFRKMANDLSKAGAATILTDEAYTLLATVFAGDPGDDPAKLGAWEVQEDHVILRQTLDLTNDSHRAVVVALAGQARGEAAMECPATTERAAILIKSFCRSRDRWVITQHQRGDERGYVDFDGNADSRVDFRISGGKLTLVGGFATLVTLLQRADRETWSNVDALAKHLNWA